MSKFSICIPTYEMGGYGYVFLNELLTELKQQSFQDFEIVISDQSDDDKILEVCTSHSSDLEILYIKYPENKGKAACNINNAMKHARGEIIKILYQDDFFVDADALVKIVKQFDSGAKWVINGFTHSHDKKQFFNTRIPFYGDHVLLGENTVGNPSNVSIINDEDKIYMDESILYVVDCEYYYRVKQKYGLPSIIQDILVCARHHPVSAVDKPEFYNLKNPEVKYCLNKHDVKWT
jgi:glycosyltransferase involved in cell wall biosynthesis